MSDYRSISETIPKNIFEPKSERPRKNEEGGFFFKPDQVKVKMFLDEEDLTTLEPAFPADPTTIDCSDQGKNEIPQEILQHIIEQTEYFETMLRALNNTPTKETNNAKSEFLGTAPSLIKNLALRVKYLQAKK